MDALRHSSTTIGGIDLQLAIGLSDISLHQLHPLLQVQCVEVGAGVDEELDVIIKIVWDSDRYCTFFRTGRKGAIAIPDGNRNVLGAFKLFAFVVASAMIFTIG